MNTDSSPLYHTKQAHPPALLTPQPAKNHWLHCTKLHGITSQQKASFFCTLLKGLVSNSNYRAWMSRPLTVCRPDLAFTIFYHGLRTSLRALTVRFTCPSFKGSFCFFRILQIHGTFSKLHKALLCVILWDFLCWNLAGKLLKSDCTVLPFWTSVF